MKFKQRLLFAGFIISFLVVGALSVLSYVQSIKLAHRVNMVEHTHKVANTINDLSSDLLNVDKAAFRFLAVKDSVYYDMFLLHIDSLLRLTSELKGQTTDSVQQNNVVELQSDLAVYTESCRKLFQQLPMSIADIMATSDYDDMLRKRETATQQLKRMSQRELKTLEFRAAERANYLQLNTSMTRTLSVIFSVLTVLLFIMLLREFRKRVSYQEELQQKIAEIAQSKRELEHIAYATSHDLQEPLRKIRILTDRWQGQFGHTINKEGNDVLERIVNAAARMQDLVGELMTLASLNADARMIACPLKQHVAAVVEQMQEPIRAKGATLEISTLPVISGYPDQIRMLFRHLIDNALKFSKPGEPAWIRITSRKAGSEELSPEQSTEQRYHCIIVEDRGIGFDNKNVEKMFGIFRQLHNVQEGYTGKGTGLAICQRIMANHKGYILAHGFIGEGATFKLYFPLPA
jgi:signal transduction histidine kinase